MEYIIHRAIVITAQRKQAKEIMSQARWLGMPVIQQLNLTPTGYITLLVCPESNFPETQKDTNERYARQNFLNWLLSHQDQHQAVWMDVEYGTDVIGNPLANISDASAYRVIERPLHDDMVAAISKLTYIEARALGVEALWNQYHPDKQETV